MNLNATLLVQMLTFALFVWFTMKLVWPHIITALQERQSHIAAGIAAADKSKRDLELAQRNIVERTREMKAEATEIINRAHKQANKIIDDSKNKAREEGERLIGVARTEIEKEVQAAKAGLRQQLGQLAVQGAERILQKNIDQSANQKLIDTLIDEI